MAEPDHDSDPSLSLGTQRQMDIYLAGLAGQMPAQAVSLEDLDQAAKCILKPEAYHYLAGGAGGEDTMRANLTAFRRWRLVPRLLRDVGIRDLSVQVLGQKLPAPLLLAPIGVQGILHRDADIAVARAARSLGIPFIVSTASSRTMEQVAAEMQEAPHWFQLYWPRNDELTASFLRRAEQAGYSAIVVTLDTYLLAWRERDIQNAYLPFVHGEGLANYFSDPVFCAAVGGDPRKEPRRAIEYFASIFSDPSRTWHDLPRLRALTRLPILLKGILHPDDARRALDLGIEGIIVSNHGGRQLDGAIATLDALPRIVDAVGAKTTVLFDSGIRRGADVLKAMALGARSVLVGRPYGLGLAVNGEQGVRDVLANLIADIDLTLGLTGCSCFAELSPENLVAESRSAADHAV
jgi:isopentenyl diphosphate isomerase/L-lactate dehydrogenase-like FMN-dependent dehydrogenase